MYATVFVKGKGVTLYVELDNSVYCFYLFRTYHLGNYKTLFEGLESCKKIIQEFNLREEFDISNSNII